MFCYFILFVSVLLFSSQFLFNQKFQEKCGSDFQASMVFSFVSSFCGFFVLLVVNGFKMEFSLFSFIVGIFYSLVGILYTFASIKAFDKVNLSAYSVFAMLGGMLVPSVYGIAFNNEEITAFKLLCYMFTVLALLFTIDFKDKKTGKIYYALVFLLNGLTGVISVIHQSNTVYHVADSFSFLMLARISTTIMCVPFCLKNYNTVKAMITKETFLYSFGFAVFCGVGNLFVLIALKYFPASVQYPIITGGVMLVSLIISIIRKENVNRKNIYATVVAFLSTIFLAV